MSISVQLYRMLESVDPGLRDVLLAILEEMEKQQRERVTKDEFIGLKQIVAELAEAQKRTEARVEELAEAQKRTEARVEELAEAQKRTEQEIKKLAKGLRETRQMVGGLSDTVGYSLEDRAITSMPTLLRQRYGMEPDGGFVRKFIEIDNRETELNIFGTAHKDSEEWFIVGEGKSKLSRKDIDKFIKVLDRLRSAKVVGDHVLPIMVTYSTRPATEDYAKEKGIDIIWSYELGQV